MSHFKERKEKNCLNCNAQVNGRYCEVCGQENIEPHETFWHLVSHFFNDITHFDGKFFSTTSALLTKPGFLPKEYLQGRRQSYLHPIRMYVFGSALFFLAFFGLQVVGKTILNERLNKRISYAERIDQIDSIMKDAPDSITKAAFLLQREKYKQEIDGIDSINDLNKQGRGDVSKRKEKSYNDITLDLNAAGDSVKTVEQYEERQHNLPKNKRDNWFKKLAIKKQLDLNVKYRFKISEYLELLKEKFLHSLPQMFFASLPLFAFILYLLYIRRKQYYYTDHAIFSVYHFTAVFVMGLIMILITKLKVLTHWDWIGYLNYAILLYAIFYLYKSMRIFYGQRRGKTIAKFILLFTLSGIVTTFLAILFLLITFFKV